MEIDNTNEQSPTTNPIERINENIILESSVEHQSTSHNCEMRGLEYLEEKDHRPMRLLTRNDTQPQKRNNKTHKAINRYEEFIKKENREDNKEDDWIVTSKDIEASKQKFIDENLTNYADKYKSIRQKESTSLDRAVKMYMDNQKSLNGYFKSNNITEYTNIRRDSKVCIKCPDIQLKVSGMYKHSNNSYENLQGIIKKTTRSE